MYKIALLLAILAFLFSCKLNNKPVKHNDSSVVQKDSFQFLAPCKSRKLTEYIGGLQWTKHSKDSTGYLCFLDNFTSPTYQVILVYKGGVNVRKSRGWDGLEKPFFNGCANDFSNFDCFAFVLPIRDPEKQEDMHANNIVFPCAVKVYKRLDNRSWHYIKTQSVKTLEQLGNLKFETIYSH